MVKIVVVVHNDSSHSFYIDKIIPMDLLWELATIDSMIGLSSKLILTNENFSCLIKCPDEMKIYKNYGNSGLVTVIFFIILKTYRT